MEICLVILQEMGVVVVVREDLELVQDYLYPKELIVFKWVVEVRVVLVLEVELHHLYLEIPQLLWYLKVVDLVVEFLIVVQIQVVLAVGVELGHSILLLEVLEIEKLELQHQHHHKEIMVAMEHILVLEQEVVVVQGAQEVMEVVIPQVLVDLDQHPHCLVLQ